MKILIMGLPGAGKTWLADWLQHELDYAWYNADVVRKMANDWDFSVEGRIRQANRMKTLADFEKSQGRTVMCDFVCPTKETRSQFEADVVIWVDTIDKGRFENTNKVFESPEENEVDYHITEKMTLKQVKQFAEEFRDRYAA